MPAQVPDFPRYTISRRGVVTSFARKTPKVKTHKIDKYGYSVVSLTRNKGEKQHTIQVHRLVALAYIPNPLNLPQVNHEDGNKQNNSVGNLKWCTNSYNQCHRYKVLGHAPSVTSAKLSEADVKQIRTLAINTPQADIATRFGIPQSSVSKIVSRKQWKNVA